MWKSRLRIAAATAIGVATGVLTFLAGLAGAAALFGGGMQGVYTAAFVALVAALVVFVVVLVVSNRAASGSEGVMPDDRTLGRLRVIPCDRKGHEKGCGCTVSSYGVALMDLPVWWIDRDGVRHTRLVKAGQTTGRLGEGELVDAVEAGTGVPIMRKTRAKRPKT